MSISKFFLRLIALLVLPFWAFGASSKPPKDPVVPAYLDFVRSLDSEAYVERLNDRGKGAQTFRMRTRYLDPDVNAFVGFMTGLDHFNQDLRVGPLIAQNTSNLMWNWGIDLGLQRGKQLWELDIMGSVLSSAVGPAIAIVGEREINGHWNFYERHEANFFTSDNDIVIDSDQGLAWQSNHWGATFGYRIFAARHMSRSGPRVGVRWRFENPKIPFIFPSLG